MKKLHLFVSLALLLRHSSLSATRANEGVDDLRGRWDVEWTSFHN